MAKLLWFKDQLLVSTYIIACLDVVPDQGRIGPFLVAGMPRYECIFGQFLAGLYPADAK